MLPWYVFALAAAACIVIRDLAQKRALREEHTEEMLVARSVFLVPLLFLLLFFVDAQLPSDTLLQLYVVSIVVTMGYLLLFKGLRHRDVSFAGPLQNISPIFLLIISVAFLNEHPTWVQVAGILLIVVGTYILEEAHSLRETFRKLYRDKYAWGIVIAAFLLSVGQTMDKHFIGGGVDPFAYLFWVWLFFNINCWLYRLGRYKWWGELERDVVRDWRWLGLAAAALFGQLVLYYLAVQSGPITLVVPITRLSAFGLVFLGGALYHEGHGERRAAAVAVMLLGAILIIAPNL